MIEILTILSIFLFVALGFSDVIKDALAVLKTSGVIADGNGTGILVGPTKVIKAVVLITAVSGTDPTLDLKIQDSDNDSTYYDNVILPQITAVGKYVAYFKTNRKYVRYNATNGGTSPQFTGEILLDDQP